jgi:hypothetical protein
MERRTRARTRARDRRTAASTGPEATTELMTVMARTCGHGSRSGFERRDPTTWKEDAVDPTGVGGTDNYHQ